MVGTLTAGQFAIYGDIKKVLGEFRVSCYFQIIADRLRCDWWRRNLKIKERCSAEALVIGVSIDCMPGQWSVLFSRSLRDCRRVQTH